MNGDDLIYAATSEGKAYRESGLRSVEADLLAKQDWETSEQREHALANFYRFAAQLRAFDAHTIADDL